MVDISKPVNHVSANRIKQIKNEEPSPASFFTAICCVVHAT